LANLEFLCQFNVFVYKCNDQPRKQRLDIVTDMCHEDSSILTKIQLTRFPAFQLGISESIQRFWIQMHRSTTQKNGSPS
ncbi:hypothetical protein LWT01_22105, partial [Enterobacter hormaechei]|nr:hypothetical protein [Enterobacter hormaechei]